MKALALIFSTLILTGCLSSERSLDGVAEVWSSSFGQTQEAIVQTRTALGQFCLKQDAAFTPQLQQGMAIVRTELVRLHTMGELAGKAAPFALVVADGDAVRDDVESYLARISDAKQKYANPFYHSKALLSATAMEYFMWQTPELLVGESMHCQAMLNIIDEFNTRFAPYALAQKDGIYPWLINITREQTDDVVMNEIFKVIDRQFEFALQNINALAAGEIEQTSSPFLKRPLVDVLTALETANAAFVQSKFTYYLAEQDQQALAEQVLTAFNTFFVKITQMPQEQIDAEVLADLNQQVTGLRQIIAEQVQPSVLEFVLAD